MRKTIFWIALILASAVTAFYISWHEHALQGDLFVEVAPHILGQVSGLMLIPVVIVGLVILLAKLFKSKLPDAIVLILVAIVWLVVAISNIRVANYESSFRTAAYIFKPKGCEYAVKFPATPKFYSTDIENTAGKIVPLQGAQLTVGNGRAFLRAECGLHGSSAQSQPSKEQMYRYMKIISSRLGLQLPAYEYRKNNSETVGKITGTKTSEQGSVTFQVINYIGKTSTMTLYVGSLSTDFMTHEMHDFMGSIKGTEDLP